METTNPTKLSMQALWQLLQPSVTYDTRGRYERCSRDWNAMDEQQQLRVYKIIENRITQGEGVNPNPYYALNDAMQEDEQTQAQQKQKERKEPTNYNGSTLTPPAPIKPACYKGEWGMYTQQDIDLFHLKTKEKK